MFDAKQHKRSFVTELSQTIEDTRFHKALATLKKFMRRRNYKEREAEHNNIVYGKLKTFLFKIKQVELNYRSGSKIFKKYTESLSKKFDSIKEDPKILKPDLVFNF